MKNLKAGIFDGHQIRHLIIDSNLTKFTNGADGSAWCSFLRVVTNALGNHKANNYEELVQTLKKLGNNKSIKVHFLQIIK